MAPRADLFELGSLALDPGEARTVELVIDLEPVTVGTQRYEPRPTSVPARLDVSRTVAGWSLRLRLDPAVEGPCTRCLESARVGLALDLREYDQPGGGEELTSPYIEEAALDLRAWARDAVVLELPTYILCRENCLGICSICGTNLNEADPGHDHPIEPDSRWAKLSDLRFE